MSGLYWVILTSVLFAYMLVAKRMGRTAITGPILFAALGLALGPIGPSEGISENVGIFLELTLALVLFTDAFSVDLDSLRKELFVPARLLGIGLPLTILAGLAVALVVFDVLDLWEAAVLAVVLSPTDAALGQAAVSNRRVPRLLRQALNVESGLNDGIAVPLLSIFVVQGLISYGLEPAGELGRVFLEEVGFGLVAGLVVGWVGGKLLLLTSPRGWTGPAGRVTSIAVLAILAFLAAAELGGSGFISAFVAGSTFGSVVRSSYPDIAESSEGIAGILTLLAFFTFGAGLLSPRLDEITGEVLLYAILSLTLVRMIPVGLAMLRSGLRPQTNLFLGWFGPRGLASLVFSATIVLESGLPNAGLINLVVLATVGLSILAHGLTAWPGSTFYANWVERETARDSTIVEAGSPGPQA